VPDVEREGAHVRRRQVVVAGRADEVARERAPDAEAAQRRAEVGERDRSVLGQVRAHPRDVVAADRAAGDDPEAIVGQARDRQVAHDPGARREHRRVDDDPDRLIDVVGGEVLQEAQCAGAADLDLGERGEVEDARALAAGAVLGLHDRRPEARGPRVVRHDLVAGEQLAVALVPLRALPAGALEELRAERLLALVERRRAQPARLLVLLARVQDVVDLAIALGAAQADVRGARAVGVEALRVALVEVEQRVAVGHQLGEGAAAAGRVRDPDRLREPEVARGRALAEQRKAVGRERHQAVEGARQLDVAQRGQQAPGLGARAREVLRGERQLRGALGVGEARLVTVVADRVVVGDLAEVHRVVLVAQDRVHDLARLARELGQRRGVGELMLDGHERDVEARREPRHVPPPDAGRDDDVLGADRAQRGLDADRPPALDEQAGDLAAAEDGDRLARAEALGRLHRLGDAVVGDEEAAEDGGRIEQRDELGHLRGVEQARVEPVAARPPQRRSSSTRRSSVVATSIEPTGWKASTSISFATVHCASRVIVRDGLCWKTRPGACDVEPPVWNSGPWSTTTTSCQPRSARWWATLAPAIPAPTITARALAGTAWVTRPGSPRRPC
jgi:hypothetical protein